MMLIDFLLIGRRIQKYRKKNGISREYLASMVGISSGHLGNIECGNKTPGIEVLVNIAVALKVSVNDLLVDLDFPPSEWQEVSDIFRECTPEEKEIFKEMIICMKPVLRKYNL